MPRSGTEYLSSIKTAIEIMSGKIDELYDVEDDASQIKKIVGKLQYLVEFFFFFFQKSAASKV